MAIDLSKTSNINTDNEYDNSQFIDDMYDHVYYGLLEYGICQQTIDNLEKDLQNNGLSLEEAKKIIEKTINSIYRQADSDKEKEIKEFREDIKTGLIIVVVGIAATLISYAFTAPGGTYLVFGGAIICGLIKLFKGIIKVK